MMRVFRGKGRRVCFLQFGQTGNGTLRPFARDCGCRSPGRAGKRIPERHSLKKSGYEISCESVTCRGCIDCTGFYGSDAENFSGRSS